MTDSATIKSFKKAIDAFLTSADYVSFMQDQLPDEMWCTDPQYHVHTLAFAEGLIAVIADVDTHENRETSKKAERTREAQL